MARSRTDVSRRAFLAIGGGAAAFAALPAFPASLKIEAMPEYPGWKTGELDIHFIQTGVGEQVFFILPDGTTILLDCGDCYKPQYLQHIPRVPSPERLGGEWVSRYVQKLVPERHIDYFLLSHWHADHCGDPGLRFKQAPDGRKLCGITLFAEDFAIRNYFDHQYPDAGTRDMRLSAQSLAMVREWIPYMNRKCGMKAHRFEVGASNQIAMLRDPGPYAANFEIRNLFANAVYWDGRNGTVDYAPEFARMRPGYGGKIPENVLSMGIRMSYGPFKAYFGGDIDFPAFEDVLAPVAGPVDVCKMNHHGCATSMGEKFCAATRAQIYVSSTWSPNQVTDANLVNMASRKLYPGDRLIMPGFMPDIRRAEYKGRDFMDDIPGVSGHRVFKVAPGGKTFEAFVLSAWDESMAVLWRREFVSAANSPAADRT